MNPRPSGYEPDCACRRSRASCLLARWMGTVSRYLAALALSIAPRSRRDRQNSRSLGRPAKALESHRSSSDRHQATTPLVAGDSKRISRSSQPVGSKAVSMDTPWRRSPIAMCLPLRPVRSGSSPPVAATVEPESCLYYIYFDIPASAVIGRGAG